MNQSPSKSPNRPQPDSEYYRAFLDRDSNYDGIFFAGVRSTGIFCRPTCSARKPKLENCEFFATAQDALLAGYRPCKRCHPTDHPGSTSPLIKELITLVESDLTRRWKDQDLRARGIDPTTARRQFKSRFGMTFVAYARARRMGEGLKTIRSGERVIDAQIDSGYESGSGFRDAFSKMMGSPPSGNVAHTLKAEWIDTPLGPMIALADESALHLLEFVDRRGLETEILRLRQKHGLAILPGRTPITELLESELASYFRGQLQEFTTPLHLYGSDFQKSVLKILQQIPYGETWTYAQQSEALGNPKAIRAVARANGMNQIPILIPCHRVIGSDGKLTGYSGGLARKEWLLDLEKRRKS